MSELSIDSLRYAVSELLIKTIGDKLDIEPIRNFDKSKSSPRAYFLGLNPITDLLHWIFINDFYKISAFDKLPTRVQNQLEKKVIKVKGQCLINVDNASDQLIDTSKGIFDPTRFLESPKEPGSYPIDEKGKKQIPKIYVSEDLEMEDEEKISKYNGKLGLTMKAFSEKVSSYSAVYFSPYAILDPRSCEPGYWDVILGIESAIYLPIE